MKTHPLFIALTCSVLVLSACDRNSSSRKLPQGAQPRTLEPKPLDADPEPVPLVDSGSGVPTEEELLEELSRRGVPGMSYLLPEGWSIGPPKAMRLLTLLPPAEFEGAQLAIAKWPGDVGGFQPNIARWAMQSGIKHDAAARTGYPQLDVGGTQSAYIPLVNKTAGNAILALWVPRGENPDKPTETWTFKLTCTAEQAIKLEPALKEFVKTVRFE